MNKFYCNLSAKVRSLLLLVPAAGLLSLSSCVSLKDITYFQPKDPASDTEVVKISQQYAPLIKPGDILSIRVASANQEASAMFNPVQDRDYYNNTSIGTVAPHPIEGFTVDADGYIALPMVGKVKASGYKSQELAGILTSELRDYLQSPTVTVRIANSQVSIMGEVTRPAVYTISNEVITLPEALALAGDITNYGKKKSILIIRETEGNREFARVDITGREFFDSPYYYLHSGDIVYVEPTSGKTTSSDRAIQLAPVVISSLTLIMLIISTL